MQSKKAIYSKLFILKKSIISITLIWALLTISLLIISHFFYADSIKEYRLEALSNQKAAITEARSSIQNNFSWLLRDLDILQENFPLENLSDSTKLNKLNAYFESFMKTRPGIYDQVRFIDTKGNEVIRIDASVDELLVANPEKLQNKKERYYFQETIQLGAASAYLSPLDLNIEHGKIEMPINPVIRIASPSFDKEGNKIGICVLNVSAKELLTRLKELSLQHNKKLWLLNATGHWLLSDKIEDEWGFMYPERNKLTLYNQIPELWNIMNTSQNNTLASVDITQGLFSYQRLDLFEKSLPNTRLKIRSTNDHWFLVSLTDNSSFDAQMHNVKQRYVVSFVMLWMLFGSMSIWIGIAMARRRLAYLELKDNENQMRSFFEFSPDALIISNNNGEIRFLNKNAEKEFGYSRTEIIGKPIEILIPERFRHSHIANRAAYMQAPIGREMGQGINLVARAKDGSEIPVKISLNNITSSQESYVIATIRNISHELILESKQREQEQLLIQQSKMAAMGEMIGAIAHQWRQPLTAIGGTLINLKDAYKYNEMTDAYFNDKIKETLQYLSYMSQTINDFKNFFTPKKQREEFCLIEGMLKALNMINPQFDHHHLNLTLSITRNGSTKTITDFSLIENIPYSVPITGQYNEFIQVIFNLISNAKDAIEESINLQRLKEGEGNITITIVSDEHGAITVLVEDNGGGIPEKIQDRIFEPYFSNKKEGKGSGIGLYMSKIIIEKSFGGTIKATNTENGTILSICFPTS